MKRRTEPSFSPATGVWFGGGRPIREAVEIGRTHGRGKRRVKRIPYTESAFRWTHASKIHRQNEDTQKG